MSRKIDLTRELSPEDRQYLVDRSRLHDLALNEQYVNGGDVVEPDRLPQPSTSGQDTRPDATPANAGAQVPAEPTTVPDGATAQTADSAAGSAEPDDNYDDEEAWSYAELKDEVKSVNEDLDEADRQALNGSREDFIAFLRKHDAEQG